MKLEIDAIDYKIICNAIMNGKRVTLKNEQMKDILNRLLKENPPIVEVDFQEEGYNLYYDEVTVIAKNYQILKKNKIISDFLDKNLTIDEIDELASLQRKKAKEILKKSNNKKVNRNASRKVGTKIISVSAIIIMLIAAGKVIKSEQRMKQVLNYSNKTEQYYVLDEYMNDSDLASAQPPIVENNLDEDFEEIMENVKEENEEYQETIEPSVLRNEFEVQTSFSCEDRTDSEKLNFVKTNYEDIITKYAKMYGLDANLVMAIATQERGKHSETRDSSGAYGLMQIEGIWVNSPISAYNVETNQTETIVITEEKLQSLEGNIQVGCCILQNACKENNYQLYASIQAYNYGSGNMRSLFNEYNNQYGISREEVLNDKGNSEFLKCCEYVSEERKQGDPQYVSNVLSYLDKDQISFLTQNGEQITYQIDFNGKVMKNS